MSKVKPGDIVELTTEKEVFEREQESKRNNRQQERIGDGFSERDTRLVQALTALSEVLEKILQAQLECNKLIKEQQAGTPSQPVTTTEVKK